MRWLKNLRKKNESLARFLYIVRHNVKILVMKKILVSIVLIFMALTGFAQRYYHHYIPHYYSGYDASTSPFSKDGRTEPGVRFSWPVETAFTLGRTFINGEDPEYGGASISKDYLVLGGKICGLIVAFGDNLDFTNEHVLGYSKNIEGHYMRYGLELGRLYITDNSGRTHSISVAPIYTDVMHWLRDGSGNNIGWSDYDFQRRQEFYNRYPDTSKGYMGGWGVMLNYNYEYVGLDVSIGKRLVEVSLVLQLDFNPWIHNLIHRTTYF